MSVPSQSFIARCKVDTRGASGHFCGRRQNRYPECHRHPCRGRSALNVVWPLSPRVKYDLAKGVIWRGPVRQLWQPPSTLSQSHCLSLGLCIAASLRYLIYPSHILSHLFFPTLLSIFFSFTSSISTSISSPGSRLHYELTAHPQTQTDFLYLPSGRRVMRATLFEVEPTVWFQSVFNTARGR